MECAFASESSSSWHSHIRAQHILTVLFPFIVFFFFLTPRSEDQVPLDWILLASTRARTARPRDENNNYSSLWVVFSRNAHVSVGDRGVEKEEEAKKSLTQAEIIIITVSLSSCASTS